MCAGVRDCRACRGNEKEVASSVGKAGRRQHRRGVPLRRPGVSNPSRAPQETHARRQRGASAQRPG